MLNPPMVMGEKEEDDLGRTDSERYVKAKGYKDGQTRKQCREPRGFFDLLFQPKQASRENRMYVGAYKAGKNSRNERRK